MKTIKMDLYRFGKELFIYIYTQLSVYMFICTPFVSFDDCACLLFGCFDFM